VVDWRDADALPGWDALARNAVEPNPFLEDWYLLPALRAMGAGHVQLLCLEVEGALAGLMPLAASRRYYGRPLPHLAAWTHPNAFFGAPLVRAAWSRLSGRHCWPMPMRGPGWDCSCIWRKCLWRADWPMPCAMF
jgi:hypothetical protein